VAVKHKLLDTPAESVPHEFAQEVIDFCKPIDTVTAAYVGLTEVTEGFHFPHKQLAAAFELAAEDDAALRGFADAFYASMPPGVQAGGCNVLDAGGVAAWRALAQRVFAR
jgi:hypothetical protein